MPSNADGNGLRWRSGWHVMQDKEEGIVQRQMKSPVRGTMGGRRGGGSKGLMGGWQRRFLGGRSASGSGGKGGSGGGWWMGEGGRAASGRESGPVIYRLQWCECGHVSETFPSPQTPFITAPRLSGHNFSPLGGAAVVINAGQTGKLCTTPSLCPSLVKEKAASVCTLTLYRRF